MTKGEAVKLARDFASRHGRSTLPEPTLVSATFYDEIDGPSYLHHRPTWDISFDPHLPPGTSPQLIIVYVDVTTRQPYDLFSPDRPFD